MLWKCLFVVFLLVQVTQQQEDVAQQQQQQQQPVKSKAEQMQDLMTHDGVVRVVVANEKNIGELLTFL